MKIDWNIEGSKKRYLQAGLTLLARYGYNAVSVRDIAKEAGTSEAALYKHFKSKEEMALSLFKIILKHYTPNIQCIADDQTKSCIERLCEMQQYTYECYQLDAESVQFALLSQYQLWDQVEDALKPHFWMKAVLEEGINKGEIEPKPIYIWISLYTGLILEPLVQYPFFHDAIPSWDIFSQHVLESVQKLLLKNP